MQKTQSRELALITIEIDSNALITIIGAIIAIAVYVGILEYRFRRVEKHPFIRGLREIQDDQLMDVARKLIKGDDK
jgi:hypothetical protein